MRIMGRSMRMLSVAARICAGLFFVWVISGVLEAMGIPIREWMVGIASQLPDLGALLKAFWRGCLRHPKIFAKNCGNAGMVWQMNAEAFSA